MSTVPILNSDKTTPGPKLTNDELEAAVLYLLSGKWNSWAGVCARPEAVQRLRDRADRARRAEEVRLAEAPLNRALEHQRRFG